MPATSLARELLLELPVDQFERYQVVTDLLAALDVPPQSTILDVSGGPGLAEAFFADHQTTTVAHESMQSLPQGDRSFAVGVALDTFELLHPDARAHLISELCRVCDVVIVSAPFADPSVRLAEAALREFVLQRLGLEFASPGTDAIAGLPDLTETVTTLTAGGWSAATLPSGYLPRWLAGMLLRHELLASGMTELPRLNAFYNSTVAPQDRREPSYRHVVVAAREIPAAQLAAAAESLRSGGDDAQGEVAVQVISAALLAHGLKGSVQGGDAASLQAEIARRDTEIADLRNLNAALQAELQIARDATLREARRSVSSVVLQRASDWRAKRHAR